MKENRNRMENDLQELPFAAGKLFVVENYLEAVGVMTALKAGVAPSAVRRPLEETKVTCEQVKKASMVKRQKEKVKSQKSKVKIKNEFREA